MAIREYDFVCSLGGNCSAAHNLRFRKMRYYSLPFDWCYFEDEQPIKILAECFKNDDFSKICLKENLKNIGVNPYHSDKVQYKDSFSGYIFANHFSKTIEEGGYEPVKKILERRIKRLLTLMEKGKKGLFLISTYFEIDSNAIFELNNILKEKYKNKIFDFEVVMLNCQQDSTEVFENITLRKNKRDLNIYDFTQTNIEWQFLDDIKILMKTAPYAEKSLKNFISIRFIKRGIKINILPYTKTILYIKIYLLFRLFLILGKDKE